MRIFISICILCAAIFLLWPKFGERKNSVLIKYKDHQVVNSVHSIRTDPISKSNEQVAINSHLAKSELPPSTEVMSASATDPAPQSYSDDEIRTLVEIRNDLWNHRRMEFYNQLLTHEEMDSVTSLRLEAEAVEKEIIGNEQRLGRDYDELTKKSLEQLRSEFDTEVQNILGKDRYHKLLKALDEFESPLNAASDVALTSYRQW